MVFGSFGAFAKESCPYNFTEIRKLNICVDDTPDTYGFNRGVVVTYSNSDAFKPGDKLRAIYNRGNRIVLGGAAAGTLINVLEKQKNNSFVKIEVMQKSSSVLTHLSVKVNPASEFLAFNQDQQNAFNEFFAIRESDLNKFPIAGGDSFLYGDWEILSNYVIGSLTVRHLRMIEGYKVEDGFASKLICTSGNLDALDIHGPINEDIHLIVNKALKQVKNCLDDQDVTAIKTRVFLTSGGGYLQDGFALARILRKYDVNAIIPANQICASSCAAAFLGAKKREMGKESSILFHAPYNVKANFKKELEVKCQKTNKELENFYLEMLGKENGSLVYDRTMSYCSPNSGWTLNDDAASLFGITTL